MPKELKTTRFHNVVARADALHQQLILGTAKYCGKLPVEYKLKHLKLGEVATIMAICEDLDREV